MRFTIDYTFHSNMPSEHVQVLQTILPGASAAVAHNPEHEEVVLHHAEPSEIGMRKNLRSHMQHANDDEDDDHHGHGHGHGVPMGCAQQ